MITSSISGDNTGTAITLVGKVGMRHHVHQITFGYTAPPTAALISTTGFEGDELAFPVTAGGVGGLALPPSSYGAVGANVVVSMSAGGAGIFGYLNVFSELE